MACLSFIPELIEVCARRGVYMDPVTLRDIGETPEQQTALAREIAAAPLVDLPPQVFAVPAELGQVPDGATVLMRHWRSKDAQIYSKSVALWVVKDKVDRHRAGRYKLRELAEILADSSGGAFRPWEEAVGRAVSGGHLAVRSQETGIRVNQAEWDGHMRGYLMVLTDDANEWLASEKLTVRVPIAPPDPEEGGVPGGRVKSALGTRERRTLLKVIAALCKRGNIDLNARGVTGIIVDATEMLGHPVSDDTIRRILDDIRDALD